MARSKLPSAIEMAAFVASWWRAYGRDEDTLRALDRGDVTPLRIDGLALDAAVKTHYRAWQLIELARDKAEPLTPESVQVILQADGDRAETDTLWRQRVLFVQPLARHYRFPPRTSKILLEAAALVGLVNAPRELLPEGRDAPPAVQLVLANTPGQEIDRATRGPQSWNAEALVYEHGGMLIKYGDDGVPIDVARAELSEMDSRTSDVWRLLVAKTLESGLDDDLVSITVQPGELALAMGFKKHHKGGMRAEDLVKCAEAMTRLERLWLRVTVDVTGTGVTHPDLPGEHIAALETETKVIHVIRRGTARTVNGQRIPRYWQVALGSWAKVWPRSFAPLFRSLVELPANNAVAVWSKQVGAELAFLWGLRARSGEAQRVTISELLGNAMLLHEVERLRGRGELGVAVERFGKTMDQLREKGVHAGWAYDPVSFERMAVAERTRRYFQAWMDAVLVIHPPEAVLRALAERVLTPPTWDV